MTDYSTPSPLTKLPLRKFEHFRVSTHDAPPVPLLNQRAIDDNGADGGEILLCNNNNNSSTTEAVVPCRVCEEHVSRYTCPRCGIPYCSVTCYQSHSSSNDASNDISLSCTEGFYQERVQSITRLEQKTKQQDTHAILNRTYLQQQQALVEGGDGMEHPDDDDDDNDMTEEDMIQLLELLSLLEQQEEQPQTSRNNDNQQPQQQRIAKMLTKSPKLKAAFEAAVERGEVLPLVLEPWNPWWRPVLASSSDASNSGSSSAILENEDNGPLSSRARGKIQTLDERLLRIKPFESLLVGSSNKTMPNLTYNLLEVLYCIVWTLRLYHGSHNATNDSVTALEAASMIVQTSSVLNHDARYDTLEEVLIQVTETTASAANGDSTTPSWTTLGHDVAFLVSNPRFMGRALLEALDIVKAAVGGLKKTKQLASVPTSMTKTTTTPELADLRRKRKKIEFFLSWSQDSRASALMPENLSDDIRSWVEHWKPDVEGSGDEVQDVVLDTLLTPLSKPTTARQELSPQPRLLMQERTTTRKIQMID